MDNKFTLTKLSMKYIKAFFLITTFLFSVQIQAQSPYEFSWKKDGGLIALGGVSTGLGMYTRTKIQLLTTTELAALNAQDVNAFDRFATNNYSLSADKASDVFWAGTHVLPFLLLAGEKSRKDFATGALLYSEVLFITTGITLIIKSTTKRTRPFVYNSDAPLDKKLTRNARTAFLSGHTSVSTANCFFTAKVFSDYYPESKWKTAVWTTAAIVPAITGYLRVKAGKHYPTDTIAGYILGATTGVLIPHLHKKKLEKVSFYGGPTGMLVQVRF